MASRRQLGGGRILGSGKSLSPAAAAQHDRTASNGIHSPSPSSVSLSSQVSHTSPPSSSTETQDLSARVSLEQPDNGPATAPSRLVCPICDEEMTTLLQLNRHLDDLHQNLEEVEQDEVKNWFRTQMVKAKKFQPLAVLNQKLRALDVFEANDAAPISTHSNEASHQAEPNYIDPGDVVTKSHWQRPRSNDACSEPMCGKRLGSVSGSVNCRHCGKLFCEEHTMYQMKLSRSAQHEPVRGFWVRVCETCYKSREGYNDHNGYVRSHTQDFLTIRNRYVNKHHMETSRLEKRLTKLTQLMVNMPLESTGGGSIWPIYNTKSQRRSLEQNVVAWEEDASILKCPFCQQEFSNYIFRRHHCRTCGRVVCGDPNTACSTEIGLNVDAPVLSTSEKDVGQVTVDIRMCRDCIHTVFSRQDFQRETSQPRPDQRAYANLVQFEQGIRFLLPRFQKLLLALQDPENPPQPSQLADATRVRKRLMDSFTQYNVAARRIRDLPTTSPTQQCLQHAIYQKASTFLHTHMLPLKALPKLLKHASPHGRPSLKSSISTSTSTSDINLTATRRPSANGTIETMSVASSSVLSAMEAEEKRLRERLVVLEEQKFLVGEMADNAKKKRRFDEASALASNVLELSGEIDQIHGLLGQLDFEGVYAAATAAGSDTYYMCPLLQINRGNGGVLV